MAKKRKSKAKAKAKVAVAKTAKRRIYRAWTRSDLADLRKHSKAKTPVKTIARATKRTVGALRQQAQKLGIGLGHRR